MNHVLVFAFLITVLMGTWVGFASWQRHQRHGLPLTRCFLNYVAAFNGMAFGYLTAHYAFTNLIGSNPAEFPRFVLILSVGVFPIQSWLCWTALCLGWELRRRQYPVAARRAFVAVATALGASYVVGLTLLLQHGGILWLVRTHMVLGIVMTGVLVVVFGGLATCNSRELTEEQRRSVRRLGRGLLSGYLGLAGSVALPGAVHLLGTAAALFWLNLVPLLWLRGGFASYCQPSVLGGSGRAAIAALAKERGVTQRERQVMELIAQGKSNKEIEEQLCISFSTVKNHAYSLYRKLGVNSRAQLIHLVMNTLTGFAGTTAREEPPVRDGSRKPMELQTGS